MRPAPIRSDAALSSGLPPAWPDADEADHSAWATRRNAAHEASAMERCVRYVLAEELYRTGRDEAASLAEIAPVGSPRWAEVADASAATRMAAGDVESADAEDEDRDDADARGVML